MEKFRTQIQQAIHNTNSMREAALLLDWAEGTFTYRAKRLGLYDPNQGRRTITNNHKGPIAIPLREILDGKHPTYQRRLVKERVLQAGIKKNKCEMCGLGSLWNNKKLVLQLDHVNGDSRDHREDNLRMLCPNCHSQTHTYCGRNASVA